MSSGDGSLVVAEYGYFTVGSVVVIDLLEDCPVGLLHVLQQPSHCVRGIIGTENLSSQPRHVICQMLVKSRGGQPVEDLITFLLGSLLEDDQILEDLWIDLDLVIEANAVLAQKVEDNGGGWFQSDMLEFKRAASNGIGLIFSLFVASTECELIDQIDGSGLLSISHKLGFQSLAVVRTNLIDVIFQFSGLFELLVVALAFDI